MKFTYLPLLFILSSFQSVVFSQVSEEDKKINDWISKMTIEEKVGQMTNLTLATIAKEKDEPITLDMEKLRNVIVKHHVGSIQNVINHAYSLSEWHTIIKAIQDITLKETRLKIPSLYCIDAVHGTNFTLQSTLFPHNLGLAATRNPELAKLCGEITAKEVRATGIRWNFSPVLDVGRQPLWPRFGETFGEDTYLVGVMGSSVIKGYEGTNLRNVNSVASCMKHFLGYSMPANGKDRAAAYIPEIMLREYFLPPFKAAVDAGAHTLMVNSAEINGTPVHASRFLLTDVLRGELGFKGVVISDWEDVKKLHERHRVAESHKEAVRLSVNAGIDMCIVPYDFSFSDDLIVLVKEGRIPEERINESVRRILKLKYTLGLFESPYLEKEAVKNFGLSEYKATALEAARESVTLLKNDNSILPLAKNKKILVVGPNANSLTALNGAWSYSWQGQKPEYFSKAELTLLAAIKNKISDKVVYVEEKNLNDQWFMPSDIGSVIICLGEEAYAETPGNINDLELDLSQQLMVKKLAKFGKPVILVLTEGRPRIIREIESLAQGVVLAYWPGSQGANAIADVLFGDYNPSGKLPFTYPRYMGEMMTYDHKLLDEAVEEVSPVYKYSYQFNPQWPFGYGLSYASFEYSNFKLSANKLIGNDSLRVTVKVKNTGKMAGKETVELYSRDLYASITPSVKRLRRFKKVYLEPGASQTIEFELTKTDLAFINTDLKWVTESGDFELMIDTFKANFNFQEK